MRITTEQRDHVSERARNRRRIYLVLFVIFACFLLFLLATAGTTLLKENPPEDLQDLIDRSRPDGVWYFKVAQVKDLLVHSSLAEEPGDWASQGVKAFHPDGAMLVFAGAEGAASSSKLEEDWVVLVPIRKPQKFFHRAISRALEEYNSRRPESSRLAFQVSKSRLLISNDSERLQTIAMLEPHDAVPAAVNESTAADGSIKFTYEGSLAAAGSQIAKVLEVAFEQDVKSFKDCRVQATWISRQGSKGDVVFRFALEEHGVATKLAGLVSAAGLAPGMQAPPKTATHLEIMIHEVTIIDEPSGEAHLDQQWRWIP